MSGLRCQRRRFSASLSGKALICCNGTACRPDFRHSGVPAHKAEGLRLPGSLLPSLLLPKLQCDYVLT